MSSDSPPYEILMSPFNSGRPVEMDIKSYELFRENPLQDSHFPPVAWIAWPFSANKEAYLLSLTNSPVKYSEVSHS